MAKLSLSVAALVLVSTGAAVVHKSFAEENDAKVDVSSNVPVTVKITSGGVTTVQTFAADPNASNTAPAGKPGEKPAENAVPAVDPNEPWVKELNASLTKKVSFDFAETPLNEALDFVKELSGVKLVVDPKCEQAAKLAKVTLKMQDVEIRAALKMMTRMGELDYVLRDKAVYVTRPVNNANAAGANGAVNAGANVRVQIGPAVRPVPAAGGNGLAPGQNALPRPAQNNANGF